MAAPAAVDHQVLVPCQVVLHQVEVFGRVAFVLEEAPSSSSDHGSVASAADVENVEDADAAAWTVDVGENCGAADFDSAGVMKSAEICIATQTVTFDLVSHY